MKFLFLESFYGGSHARFADGLTAASTHDIDLVTMPGRHWKWRMLGAALYFAEKAPPLSAYDGLIVTDLFNLADFLALRGRECPPVLVYFHENQLTYPQPPGDKGAFQTGMINISTALTGRRLIFNSRFHRQAFLKAIPGYLKKGRDCRPTTTADAIAARSGVLYPGISFPPKPAGKTEKMTGPPLIIWNHRWSFDKNYPLFFSVLTDLAARGIAFKLAVLGESDGRTPPEFAAAEQTLAAAIVQFGFVGSRAKYIDWLQRGAIIVSTAEQENFGLAVIEAMSCGCVPLLPDRLSYPEILPEEYHQTCLYRTRRELTKKMTSLLTNYDRYQAIGEQLRTHAAAFTWQKQITGYDRELSALGKRTF